MNKLSAFLQRKLDNFSFDEYLIMFALCTIFLPYYCNVIAMTIIVGYIIKTKRIKKIFKEIKGSYFILIFSLLAMGVSLYYQNYEGILHGYMMFILFIFMLFYRTIVNKRLFELLMDACCIASLFCAFWAIMEYLNIIEHLDYAFVDLIVVDSPKYRVNSTFMNANYYAMMIEFMVLICIYKMMQVKTIHRIVFYISTILLNLFVLYLSGCRTAWIPFFASIPFMFLMNKRTLYITLTTLTYLSAGLVLMFKPELAHRASSILNDFMKRKKIWDAAIEGIKANFLLGRGPRTYHQIYPLYNGHKTYHAHNIYLDVVLSHGVIGVLCLFIYIFYNMKEIILLFVRRIDIRLFSLIIAFVITTLLHGLLDATIFWPQTLGLFMFVVSASSMYFNQKISFKVAIDCKDGE